MMMILNESICSTATKDIDKEHRLLMSPYVYCSGIPRANAMSTN